MIDDSRPLAPGGRNPERPDEAEKVGSARASIEHETDAAKRFLLNEANLELILAAHGIETDQLEGCSLADQIELFGNCKLLVGLHGAGLTNILWMPAGGQVLEIRSRNDSHNNCYFAMASALGHHYSYLQADHLVANQHTYSAELLLDPILMAKKLRKVAPC